MAKYKKKRFMQVLNRDLVPLGLTRIHVIVDCLRKKEYVIVSSGDGLHLLMDTGRMQSKKKMEEFNG